MPSRRDYMSEPRLNNSWRLVQSAVRCGHSEQVSAFRYDQRTCRNRIHWEGAETWSLQGTDVSQCVVAHEKKKDKIRSSLQSWQLQKQSPGNAAASVFRGDVCICVFAFVCLCVFLLAGRDRCDCAWLDGSVWLKSFWNHVLLSWCLCSGRPYPALFNDVDLHRDCLNKWSCIMLKFSCGTLWRTLF